MALLTINDNIKYCQLPLNEIPRPLKDITPVYLSICIFGLLTTFKENFAVIKSSEILIFLSSYLFPGFLDFLRDRSLILA